MKTGNQTREEVKEAARELLSNPTKLDESLNKIFKAYDKNSNNEIDQVEFLHVFTRILKDFGKRPLTENAVKEFLAADANCNKSLSKDEFKKVFMQLIEKYAK